jgi:hypothetical protein
MARRRGTRTQLSLEGNLLISYQDRILIEATQQLGRHWKDIQREHFPGRSKNTIKNRYVSFESCRLCTDRSQLHCTRPKISKPRHISPQPRKLTIRLQHTRTSLELRSRRQVLVRCLELLQHPNAASTPRHISRQPPLLVQPGQRSSHVRMVASTRLLAPHNFSDIPHDRTTSARLRTCTPPTRIHTMGLASQRNARPLTHLLQRPPCAAKLRRLCIAPSTCGQIECARQLSWRLAERGAA